MAAVQPPAHIQALSESSDVFRRIIRCFRFQQGIRSPTDLAITQNGTPNMSVNVAAGECIVDGTLNTIYQGSYHCMNDAVVNLAVAASDPSHPRIDLVVAQVQDAQYSGAVNSWQLAVVTGTPAVSPVAPATPANSMVLAQLAVAATVTTIVNANITDKRVQFNSNPYKARAFASSATLVNPSTITKIALNTASFDPSSSFSSGSNNFAAPVPGYYQVNCRCALVDNANSVQNFLVMIYKNGAENSRGTTMRDGTAANANTYGGNASDIIFLNTGDTIDMRAFTTATNGCNTESGSSTVFMSMILVST